MDGFLDSLRRYAARQMRFELLPGCAAMAMLCGCAVPPVSLQGHPKFGDVTTPMVLIGHFTEAKHLDAEPCPTSDDVVLDCFGPDPKARIAVKEVLFGRIPSARFEVLALYTKHPERFPIGRENPLLIFLAGYSFADHETGGFLSGFRALHRLESGELAMAVATKRDLPDLPCSGERLLEVVPLNFAQPQPRRPLDEYSDTELTELRHNPRVDMRAGNVHFKFGITLASIRTAIETMAKEEYFAACWENDSRFAVSGIRRDRYQG
jgi:hypothetical protein